MNGFLCSPLVTALVVWYWHVLLLWWHQLCANCAICKGCEARAESRPDTWSDEFDLCLRCFELYQKGKINSTVRRVYMYEYSNETFHLKWAIIHNFLVPPQATGAQSVGRRTLTMTSRPQWSNAPIAAAGCTRTANLSRRSSTNCSAICPTTRHTSASSALPLMSPLPVPVRRLALVYFYWAPHTRTSASVLVAVCWDSYSVIRTICITRFCSSESNGGDGLLIRFCGGHLRRAGRGAEGTGARTPPQANRARHARQLQPRARCPNGGLRHGCAIRTHPLIN